MPLIIFLIVIIICLLFVVRQLRATNQDLQRKIAEDVEFLQQVRTKDPLTQVMTRREFRPLISQEWQRARRSQQPLTLIACDLDYFKEYNETYSRIVGDECLYNIAQTLENTVKRAGECVCRMGGEEFWVLLPNVDQEQAIKVAALIKKNIATLAIPHIASPVSEHVTASLGICSRVPEDTDSQSNFLNAVDEAMQMAKEQGRDRWSVAD
ncbi:MAG: diguanylate cyclase [Limnothrix sp.]